MLTMTDIAAATNRLVLLAPRREGDNKVRRYRIARLKVEDAIPFGGAATDRADRFAHLKHAHD